jgi:excisionase family DNA binding protein
MLALPEPVRGGSVSELRRFVNVGSDADFTLLLAWLVTTFRPRGPYPALGLHGEQGSAKSTSARLLRALVDPNAAGLRSEPREDRDLMIAATNGWCIAFDNLSKIPLWLSDGLCRLATGGGFTTRELYTNDEEVLFDAQRPVVLNGIEEVATRPDLLDRAIILGLPTIPEERRMKESALWREFNEARPRILGAMLDAVSDALRNESQVILKRLPRMADFAVWATAAEPGLGLPEGSFLAAYERNRASANDLALEASAVAPEILRVMANRDSWTVTYTALLSELERVFGDSPKRPEGWPKPAEKKDGDEELTVKELAAMKGVQSRTVYDWIKEKRIPFHYTPGGRLRFYRRHAERVLSESPRP